MTSPMLHRIVDSLTTGEIGIEDFMQAVEDQACNLHSGDFECSSSDHQTCPTRA